jgi:hypothetical protein
MIASWTLRRATWIWWSTPGTVTIVRRYEMEETD